MSLHTEGLRLMGPIPDNRKVFERKYRIGMDEADPQSRVRLDAVARFVQDTGMDILAETELGKHDPFWIVRRSIIDIIEPITWPGYARASWWVGAVSRHNMVTRQTMTGVPTVSRFSSAERPAGRVETETFSVNVTREGRPSPVSDATLAGWRADAVHDTLVWKPMNAATPPVDQLEYFTSAFSLRTTDFDAFGHMNNAAYWHIVEYYLQPLRSLHRGPYRAVIEFLKPIRPRREVLVSQTYTDDKLGLWLIADGAVTTTVVVTKLG